MFDTAVKFEDVSAETIAMEDVQFEDIDTDMLCIEHFEDLRQELNVDSVWSIWDAGTISLDTKMFNDRMRKVTYDFIRADATSEEIYKDLEDGGKRSMVQVSSWAVNGSIKSLWLAADSCIKQSGTHHSYIENFEMQDDGSLSLVTGS